MDTFCGISTPECFGETFPLLNTKTVDWYIIVVKFINRCTICSSERKTLYAIRAHLREHEIRQAPKKYSCSECGKSFYKSYDLNKHLKDAHGTGNKFDKFLNFHIV